MQSLSKEAEQKLISAIEKAAAYVNDGMSPNDAIIKSASAANVPAGHINLMVHAYNTGRTTKQREQGENTLEKAADFQLADAKIVMEALYPATVKTSAEIVRQQVVSTDYAISPAGMLARRRAEQEKAAAAMVALPEKTWTPPPRDEAAEVRRAYSEKRAAQLAQEELRRKTTDAYVKAAASMDKLIEYFRTPGNMSYGDAMRQVELRFGADGVAVLQKAAAVYPAMQKQAATKTRHFGHNSLYDLVDEVLNKVANYIDAHAEYGPKKADAVGKKTAPEFLTGSVMSGLVGEPIELMKAAVTGSVKPLRDYGNVAGAPGAPWEARREAEITRGERAKDRQQRDSILGDLEAELAAQGQSDALSAANQQLSDMTLSQFGHDLFPITNYEHPGLTPFPSNPFDGLSEKILGVGAGVPAGVAAMRKGWNEAAPKKDNTVADILSGVASPAATVGKNMGLSVGGMLGSDKKPDDVKSQHFAALSAPEHEKELRTIRTKGVLHDLILNDPVISGYDATDVASAFNEISEIAPNLVDSPGVLRTVLRKRLEGGQLADFDLKQLLEMDKLRLERDKVLADTKKTEKELI